MNSVRQICDQPILQRQVWGLVVVGIVPMLMGHGSRGSDPGWLLWAAVVVVATSIVALSLFLAVRFLVRPGEHEGDHIKRRVLEEE